MQRTVLEKFLDSKATIFAPEARVTPAAKGRRKVLASAIEDHLPGSHATGEALGTFKISSPDRA